MGMNWWQAIVFGFFFGCGFTVAGIVLRFIGSLLAGAHNKTPGG